MSVNWNPEPINSRHSTLPMGEVEKKVRKHEIERCRAMMNYWISKGNNERASAWADRAIDLALELQKVV